MRGLFRIAKEVLEEHKLFHLILDKFVLEIKCDFNSDGKEQVEWATHRSKVPFVRRFAFSSINNSNLGYR